MSNPTNSNDDFQEDRDSLSREKANRDIEIHQTSIILGIDNDITKKTYELEKIQSNDTTLIQLTESSNSAQIDHNSSEVIDETLRSMIHSSGDAEFENLPTEIFESASNNKDISALDTVQPESNLTKDPPNRSDSFPLQSAESYNQIQAVPASVINEEDYLKVEPLSEVNQSPLGIGMQTMIDSFASEPISISDQKPNQDHYRNEEGRQSEYGSNETSTSSKEVDDSHSLESNNSNELSKNLDRVEESPSIQTMDYIQSEGSEFSFNGSIEQGIKQEFKEGSPLDPALEPTQRSSMNSEQIQIITDSGTQFFEDSDQFHSKSEQIEKGTKSFSSENFSGSATAVQDLASHIVDQRIGREQKEVSRNSDADISASIPPGYEFVKTLGRGGMGVVYLAKQVYANRLVALKMIIAGNHAGENQIRRFRTEAEAVARIQHPNIVQIYEVDEFQNSPFFSLEYCSGGSLDLLIKNKSIEPELAAKLCVQIAAGVHAGHQKGIIHRDLKPANILLTDDQIPKITDFGIAKMTDEVGQTIAGSIIGTPSYMSPEQSEGKSDQIGPATDIYSLGAVLYECLTGRPPFQGKKIAEVLTQVRQKEVVPIRLLNEEVPIDLETIALKCLQKEPHRRYLTALELKKDLECYLEGRPIAARPITTLERSYRWVRRNPLVAGLGFSLLFTLLVGIIVSSSLAFWAWREKELATNEKNRAEQNEQEARYQESLAKVQEQHALEQEKIAREQKGIADTKTVEAIQLKNRSDQLYEKSNYSNYAMLLHNSTSEWNASQLHNARALLRRCPWNLRGPEYFLLDNRMNHLGQRTIAHLQKPILALDWHHSSPIIAVAEENGLVYLYDSNHDNLIKKFQLPSQVRALCFNSNAQLLATANEDSSVSIWDWRLGKQMFVWKDWSFPVNSLSWSSDDHKLVACSKKDGISIWDIASGKTVKLVNDPAKEKLIAHAIAFSPDGSRIAVGLEDHRLLIYNSISGKVEMEFNGQFPIFTLSWRADSQQIATASWNNTMTIWDINTKKSVHTFINTPSRPMSIEYSPDGLSLACAGQDGKIALYDLMQRQQRLILYGHEGMITGLKWGNQGRQLASVSLDHSLKVWDTTKGSKTDRFSWVGHMNRINCMVEFEVSNNRFYATAGSDSQINIYDRFSSLPIKQLTGHKAPIYSVCHLHDPKINNEGFIAAGGVDKLIRIWDFASGKLIASLEGHTEPITGLIQIPDKNLLVSAGLDRTIKIWDWQKKQFLKNLEFHRAGISSLCLSRDGKYLASGSLDRTISIIDTNTWEVIQRFKGHQGVVTTLDFNLDGSKLASGSTDKTIKIWQVKSGECSQTLIGHEQAVSYLTWAGKDSEKARLISGSADKTVRFWDIKTAQEVYQLPSFPSKINSIHWSSANNELFVISDKQIFAFECGSSNESEYLPGHPGGTNCLLLDAKKKILISGGNDQIVRLWNLNTGEEIMTLNGPRSGIKSLSLSDDQSAIVAFDRSGEQWIWDLVSGKQLKKNEFQFNIAIPKATQSKLTAILDGVAYKIFVDNENIVIENESNNESTSNNLSQRISLWDYHRFELKKIDLYLQSHQAKDDILTFARLYHLEKLHQIFPFDSKFLSEFDSEWSKFNNNEVKMILKKNLLANFQQGITSFLGSLSNPLNRWQSIIGAPNDKNWDK